MVDYTLDGMPLYRRYGRLKQGGGSPAITKDILGEPPPQPTKTASLGPRVPIGVEGLRKQYGALLCSFKRGGQFSRSNSYFVIKKDDERKDLSEVHIFWQDTPSFIKMELERYPDRKFRVYIKQEEMDGSVTELQPSDILDY